MSKRTIDECTDEVSHDVSHDVADDVADDVSSDNRLKRAKNAIRSSVLECTFEQARFASKKCHESFKEQYERLERKDAQIESFLEVYEQKFEEAKKCFNIMHRMAADIEEKLESLYGKD